MNFKNAIDLKPKDFRRLTGVKYSTFLKMLEILKKVDAKLKAKGGRKNKLSMEDRLLMTLEYLREYRTYFHIGVSFGVSESTAYKTVRWVEETLIQSKEFSLPGKKELIKQNEALETVLVDVTESPLERPKKNKNNSTQARKNVILRKHKSL